MRTGIAAANRMAGKRQYESIMLKPHVESRRDRRRFFQPMASQTIVKLQLIVKIFMTSGTHRVRCSGRFLCEFRRVLHRRSATPKTPELKAR
jgi:hypothetical protein